MEGGLVTRRRAGEELIFTVEGRVVAVLRFDEVSAGAATFDLQLPLLGLAMGIRVQTSGSSATVQIVAPRVLGVFRKERFRDKPQDNAA
jgi:hypothetical protein